MHKGESSNGPAADAEEGAAGSTLAPVAAAAAARCLPLPLPLASTLSWRALSRRSLAVSLSQSPSCASGGAGGGGGEDDEAVADGPLSSTGRT